MEKSAEVVSNVIAGKPSAVVDAVAAMVQAKAAELVAAKYDNKPEEPESEADLTGAEGDEGEEA